MTLSPKKEKKNFLEFIPAKNPAYPWHKNEQGKAVVQIGHKGFYDKIAQKFFKTPKVSDIELDEIGTFVWEAIDGSRTVYDISGLTAGHFGEEELSMLNRVVKYFAILREHRFVTYREGKE